MQKIKQPYKRLYSLNKKNVINILKGVKYDDQNARRCCS